MQIDINTKKSWFSKQWVKEITASGTVSAEQFSFVVHQLLKQIAPRELFEQDSVRDLKGRDAGQKLLTTFDGDHSPKEQEFLFLSAYSDRSDTELTYGIYSDFKAFEGSHIDHSIRRDRSFSLPGFFQPELFGYVAPLTITHFRFALERFQNMFKALSFGYTPEVTERLLVDYHRGELKILASSENLEKEQDLPFAKGGEVSRILALLEH